MEGREDFGLPPLGYPYEAPERSFAQLGERTLAFGADAVDLSQRSALLAYGANAAPEALARKLGEDPDPLPLLRGVLADHDVVFSDHLSPYGAVPATILESPGTEVDVFVAYPTAAQLRLIDATEGNYERRRLAVECRAGDAEPPAELLAYVSRHGPLRDASGSPLALAAVTARGRVLPALTQAEAQELRRSRR